MFLKIKIMATLFTFMVIGAVFTPSAFAYGQCGGRVSSGSQIYGSWQKMGVTSQAAEVAQSAGFHRMDGSFKSWMDSRVVEAKLASSASPIDHGCQPGTLFSVGPRGIANGTPVLVVLPLKYAKEGVRYSPHKGYRRTVVQVRVVGKTECSNPLSGTVRVVIYVKIPKRHHHPKHKKPAPIPTPKPLPSCESQGLIGTAGNCVQQSNSAEQKCSVSGGKWNHTEQKCKITQINVNCGNVVVVEEVEGPVSVNQPKSENCKTEIVEKPCGCQPPPKSEPPVVNNLMKVQEVDVEKSSLICADVYAPAGDELTITFNAEFGEFAHHVIQEPKYGPNGVCDTYTAPSEALEETVWVFVQDKTTGLHAESERKSFKVQNPEEEHGGFH